jgi:hypothetical protein
MLWLEGPEFKWDVGVVCAEEAKVEVIQLNTWKRLADSHITASGRPQPGEKIPLGKGWGAASRGELGWSTQEVIVCNCQQPYLSG